MNKGRLVDPQMYIRDFTITLKQEDPKGSE